MQYRIGIDLGGTNIAAGVVSGKKILAEASLPTGAERGYRAVIADMARAASMAVEQAGLDRAGCTFLGIGCPGSIDTEAGRVRYANNLQWKNVPLCEELHAYFDAPSAASNDANCAALGEVLAGAARGMRDAVMLTLGTGVGSGIIIGGKIYDGMGSCGGELGHTTLIFGGEPCTCGQRGCLEAYASATALKRQTSRAAAAHPDSLLAGLAREGVSGRTAFEAMRQGCPVGRAVVEQYLTYLGAGVTNVVNIFRPQAILLGGGIAGEGETLLEPVRAYVQKNCYGAELSPMPVIEAAKLGNDAGILGAAYLR